MKDTLYLTGFMGTGKTAVGRELALRLDHDFIETDELIEAREGRPITEIFSESGEQYFRDRETELLKEIAGRSGLVVSCGGGMVISEENRKIMHDSGKVVCLLAKPEAVYNRIKNCKTRPLLDVPDPEARIKELLKQRASFYQDADLIVDTTFISIDEVVALIMEKLNDNKKVIGSD